MKPGSRDRLGHARAGKDPSPPWTGPITQITSGYSKDELEAKADDYKKGYTAGSSLRAADAKDHKP